MKFYPSGTQLGDYEIVIGPGERPSLMGGMGIVYLGFDRRDGRPVALKTFQPQFLSNRQARERFLREGQAWIQLERHPNIVHCLNIVHFRHDHVYLILEQIAPDPSHGGASLRDWLALSRKGLPLETALLFALQVVRGMAHAVERLPGFVHRDLKPGNILIGADKLPETAINRVRVTDFGLVKALSNVALPTSELFSPSMISDVPTWRRTMLTKGWVGTPLYMAPEQWSSEACTVATDVYAFGLILQEMVSGNPAINGQSLASLQAAHNDGERAALPSDIPTAVVEIIEHCTSLRSNERYQTWDEVESALQAVYTSNIGQPLPPPSSRIEISQVERTAQGWGQNSLGMSYLDIGKLDQAVVLFERVAALGQELADRALQSAGLANLGIAYRQLGDLRRAIGYFEQALAIIREIGDRLSEANTLANLGVAYWQLGDSRRAISYHEQDLVLVREIGDKDGEGIALGNLGIAYADLGDFGCAISYFESALVLARMTGDRVSEGRALGNLGAVNADSRESRQAARYFEQVLVIAQETGDRVSEGRTLSNLGLAYSDLGDFTRAINYLDQALVLVGETGDRISESQALGNLGIVHGRLGHSQQAIVYYEQVVALAQKTGNLISEAVSQHNIAIVYAEQGEIPRALTAAESAARLYKQLGHLERAQQVMQLATELRH